MSNNYLTNGGRGKFLDEEIDDDEFLRHPKTGSTGYMLPNSQIGRNASEKAAASDAAQQRLEQQRQQLVEKRREIEERTLASSERGLGLLYESEKVGVATAEELAKQKEQLLNTENRLDDINSTLRNSERHIQGIRSVFSSVRNYFGGRNSTPAITNTPQSQQQQKPSTMPSTKTTDDQGVQGQRYVDKHPGMRNKPGVARDDFSSIDDKLDRNLDDMADGLARLKGLAQGLNVELNEHSDIIDRVNDKSEVVGFKVQKQNKAMEKILKK